MRSFPAREDAGSKLALPSLEADNLLAFLALVGLLRALDDVAPEWGARVSWLGPPWSALLHLRAPVSQEAVAGAAASGIDRIVAHFDTGGRVNVDFEAAAYRTLAEKCREDDVAAALVSAIAAESPTKDDGTVRAAPLVMMFGQGHQNFLERLLSISRGDLPKRHKKMKVPPNLRDPRKLAEALFLPWTRTDDTDAFRWDPDEDQRYALRYRDPSRDGAAPTVHGANRLAAVGLLSFAAVPRERSSAAVGAKRDEDGVAFTWPLWRGPLSRHAIEALLAHPSMAAGDLEKLRPLGVVAIVEARRIANGKFMNVTRGRVTT